MPVSRSQQLLCRPAVRRVPERSRERLVERPTTRFPTVSLDSHFRPAYAQHVEGVQLPAASRRECAGLNDERGMPGDVVAIGRVSDMADVQMPGEKQVGADFDE